MIPGVLGNVVRFPSCVQRLTGSLRVVVIHVSYSEVPKRESNDDEPRKGRLRVPDQCNDVVTVRRILLPLGCVDEASELHPNQLIRRRVGDPFIIQRSSTRN